MKTSNEINELAAALSIAQGEFVSVLKKSKGVHNSSYAELVEYVDMARPHLAANGLSFSQFPYNEDSRVGVITRIMHKSGQWMEHQFSVPPAKNDAHQYGSAITYCRRYSLGAILGIPSDDDDGNGAMTFEDPKAKAHQKPVDAITGDQVKALVNLLAGDEKLKAQLMDAYGIAQLEHLQSNQFRPVYDKINKLKGVTK